MSNNNHIVIIRNLSKSSSTSDSELTNAIYDLLNTCMNISTLRNCIQIKTKDKERSAVICLRSPTEVSDVLDRLRNRSSRNSLGFSFQRIADMYVDINVETELPANFYRKGQHIGKETRQMEFKLGGGDYVSNNLRENVSKYVCGYLNGRTEGTLFIGVDDKEHVVGVNCENEDQIRRSYIDESIRDIKPPVDNKDYQVEFVPVEEDGQIKANCKVIKITVYKRKQLNRLFDSNEHVYMRRDGCVRDFSAAEAQDWILQNHSSKVCILQ